MDEYGYTEHKAVEVTDRKTMVTILKQVKHS